MKKKILILLVAVCTLLGQYSCTEEAEYNPAEISSKSQVFFDKDAKKEINLDLNQSSFNVDFLRIIKDKTLNVEIELTDTSSLFTAPSTISFAQDKDSAQLTVSFDFAKITPDNDYEISFKIKSDTSEYAPSALSIIVKYAPWSEWYSTLDEWKKAGYLEADWVLSQKRSTCSYTYSQYFSGVDEQLPIKYRQSLQNSNKGQFKIENVLYGVDLIIDYDKTKTVNNCTFSETFIGGDGVYLMPAVAFFEEYGPAREAAGKSNLDLNYDDCPLTYDKENGTFVLNVIYHAGIGYYGFTGPEICQLDGFDKFDYNVNISYLGSYQNALNKAIGAIVSLNKGADVTSFRYNIFNGELSETQVDSVAHAIDYLLTESFESAVNTQRGFVIPSEGDYTVVSVSYNADGDSVDCNSISFTYNPPMLWKSLGYCNYTDGLLAYFFTEDNSLIPTYSVEIQESTIYPNMYRLKNAYGAGYPYNEPGDYSEDDVYLVIDATDPNNVFIPEQKLGVDWGDGEMSVATGEYGSLENDTIKFPIEGLYIDSGGDNWYYSNSLGEFCIDLKNISPMPSNIRHAPMHRSYTSISRKNNVSDLSINRVSTKKSFSVSNAVANSLRRTLK